MPRTIISLILSSYTKQILTKEELTVNHRVFYINIKINVAPNLDLAIINSNVVFIIE